MQIRKFGCNLQQFPCEQTMLIPKVYNVGGYKHFPVNIIHAYIHFTVNGSISIQHRSCQRRMKKVIDNDKVSCVEDII